MQRLAQVQRLTKPSRKSHSPLTLIVLQRAFSATQAVPQPKDSKTVDANGEPRFLEQVKMFYDSGASKTGIDPQWLNLIKACQAVVRFNIPLRRDNGKLEVITCYR